MIRTRPLIGLLMLGTFAASLAVSGSSAAPMHSASRCLVVPQPVVGAISSGLTISGGGRVRHLRAVRSRDFAKVYFVSGVLTGSGFSGREVATWATNKLSVGGLIFSADSFAREFSKWGARSWILVEQ